MQYADLTAVFKFRFNEDWSQNYGDNDFNGSLEVDGANIPKRPVVIILL